MKKWLVMLMVVAALAGSVTMAAGKDTGAAAVLSAVMPGTGEWYNSNWQGSFPWGSCILGDICPCIRFSSVLDAANGNTDPRIRIDFWSTPGK